jgi:hypothetical protein
MSQGRKSSKTTFIAFRGPEAQPALDAPARWLEGDAQAQPPDRELAESIGRVPRRTAYRSCVVDSASQAIKERLATSAIVSR